MFCNKCGNVLDENGKCSNCNNLNKKIDVENMQYNSTQNLNSNIHSMNNQNLNNQNINTKKVKKRKKSGCLIVFLLIILILVGIFWGVPFVKNKIEKHRQNNIEALKELTSSEKMRKDFEEGIITADKYVKQLAYENFEADKVDDKYKSKNKEILYNHVLDIAKEHQNELSKDTLIYLYKKFCLSDVKFDVNAKKSDLDNPTYGAVYAAHDDSLRTTISKAKLSNNKRFLIWYTDTGDSKVSEKDVEQLANEIEEVVGKLEEESGISYKFENFSGTGTGESSKTKKKMKEILSANNIDEKYIDDCLNIYMCYTNHLKKDDDKSAVAYYVSNMDWLLKKIGGLADGIVGDGGLGEYSSVPNFPYVNIRPDATKNKQELKLIYTHELFHHFQKYHCGNGKYRDDKSGNFTVETTANWMSAKVNDSTNKKNFMSNWATRYVLNCDKTLDKVCGGERAGYANFVFAEIYANTVKDGKKKMLDSMKYEDALKYLVEQAGDKFDDVMIELSKQNILNDFENQTFKAYELPENSLDLSMAYAKHKEHVSEYSMRYYFLDKKNFKYNTFIDISAKYGNLNYVLIGKKGSKYSFIEKGEFGYSNNFSIETDKYFKDYDQIILSIVNSDFISRDCEIMTIKEQLCKTLLSVSDVNNSAKRQVIFDNGEFLELHVSDLSSLLKSLTNLAKESGNLALQESNDKTVQEGVQELFKQLDSFDEGVEQLNNKVNVVRIASIPIKKNLSNEDIHEDIKNLYSGFKFKIVDTKPDANTRITVGLITNMFSNNKFSFYVVCTSKNSDSFAYFVEIETKNK